MSERPEERDGAAEWFYLQDGATQGPVTLWQLRQMVVLRQVPSDILVWREGMSAWLPAGDLGLTARVVPPPPPVRQRAGGVLPGQAPRRTVNRPPADHSPREARTPATQRTRGRRGERMKVSPWLWRAIAAVSLLGAGIAIGYALHRDSSSRVAGEAVSSTDRPAPRKSSVEATRPRASDRGSSEASRINGADAGSGPASVPRPHVDLESTTTPFRPADAARALDATAGADREMAGLDAQSREGTASSAAAAAPDVAPVTHEVGPPNTLFQEVDMQRRPSFEISGGKMVQDIRYLILSRLDLQPRQADGSRSVTQHVLDTRLDRSDEMSRTPLEASLRQLKGKTFVYKLGELGDIVEFTGFDGGPGAVAVGGEGMSGFLLAEALDEDGWKEMTHLSFLEPDRHIGPGQPWTRQITHDWGQVGSWSGVTTYIQDTTVGNNTRYRYTHDLAYKPPPATLPGPLPFSIGEPEFHVVDASGWFLYDPAAQHVTEAQETFHVKGSFGSALLGETAKIEIEERQQVSIRLTRQRPW